MHARFIHVLILLSILLAACTAEPTTQPASPSITAPSGPGAATEVNATAEVNPPAEATPSAPAGQPASVPPELAYIFDIPSDPIRVNPTLASEGAVEALIPASGGSLSTTGPDGTTYTLDIPDGALAAETRIRMTPLSALEGLPFGGPSYAVQLEPEGLQFYAFATLSIVPAQEVPVEEQIFFAYEGLGENLVLAAPAGNAAEIQILVDHFSGYGVNKGFLADIEPVRARIGGEAEARLGSAIAEQLGRARQRALLGDENAGSEVDWEGFFQQWEEQVVKPRLAAAGESCAAGRLAIQTVLGYERQRALLGISEGSLSGLLIENGVMDTVAELCMKEEFELCQEDHIIHRILPAWLGLERQYQLLGAAEGASAPALEQAKQYVQRCLTFELEFHSEATLDQGADGYVSIVDAKVKLQFNPETMTLANEAPLVNTDFEFRVEGCSVENQRGGDTFTVIKLEYISDTKTPEDALGYVRDFNMVYYPGNTKESFTVTCPDTPPYPSPQSPLWTGIFLLLHEGEMSMAQGGHVATDWEIFNDEYFAKKEWIRESPGDAVFEVGTLKLYHRPG